MTWIYFEDSDRQFPAPAFSLDRAGGGKVSLQDFYEQSMLVLLFPSGRTGRWAGLERFADRLDEIERQGARVVALVPDVSQEERRAFDDDRFPYPLLADSGGRTRANYAGLMVAELVPEGSALVYVLDIYGAPWAAYVGEDLVEKGLIDEVLSWLVFIGVQCPE